MGLEVHVAGARMQYETQGGGDRIGNNRIDATRL